MRFLEKAYLVEGMKRKLFVWSSQTNVTEINTSQDLKTVQPNLVVYYSNTQVYAI